MGVTPILEHAICIRSYPGSPRGGDLGMVVPRAGGALAALVDASGHGLASHAVALAARRTIAASAEESIEEIFRKLDVELSGTIGAAISIASITDGAVVFAGIGNVAAYVDLNPLLVRFGVVGQRPRSPILAHATLPQDVWLLMHTDGVRRPDAIPRGSAETAAAALIESHGQLHDDAGVLLLRWRNTEP